MPPPIRSPSLRDFQKVLDCGVNAAETNGGTLIGDGAAAWERNLLRMARVPGPLVRLRYTARLDGSYPRRTPHLTLSKRGYRRHLAEINY
jgi:hypothetical protein